MIVYFADGVWAGRLESRGGEGPEHSILVDTLDFNDLREVHRYMYACTVCADEVSLWRGGHIHVYSIGPTHDRCHGAYDAVYGALGRHWHFGRMCGEIREGEPLTEQNLPRRLPPLGQPPPSIGIDDPARRNTETEAIRNLRLVQGLNYFLDSIGMTVGDFPSPTPVGYTCNECHANNLAVWFESTRTPGRVLCQPCFDTKAEQRLAKENPVEPPEKATLKDGTVHPLDRWMP